MIGIVRFVAREILTGAVLHKTAEPAFRKARFPFLPRDRVGAPIDHLAVGRLGRTSDRAVVPESAFLNDAPGSCVVYFVKGADRIKMHFRESEVDHGFCGLGHNTLLPEIRMQNVSELAYGVDTRQMQTDAADHTTFRFQRDRPCLVFFDRNFEIGCCLVIRFLILC